MALNAPLNHRQVEILQWIKDGGPDGRWSDFTYKTTANALQGRRLVEVSKRAGFTTRFKSEQATMRRLVIRMDTMRRTSYVSAGYLIAEITALVILVLLLITQIGEITPTVLVVGVISYLLFYALALIRDLDNPFEYRGGKPGAADVNLEVLEHSEDRLRGLLTTMGASA